MFANTGNLEISNSNKMFCVALIFPHYTVAKPISVILAIDSLWCGGINMSLI